MADNIFKQLGRLFRSNIVVRKTDNNRLVVKDVDFSQTALLSNFIDRYNRLMNGASWAQKYASAQNASAYEVARKELFKDYELMDTDPIISSALDVYSVEPAMNNVLFGLNNLILTPHIAASTEEAQLIVAKQIAEQISEFFNTGKITNSV